MGRLMGRLHPMTSNGNFYLSCDFPWECQPPMGRLMEIPMGHIVHPMAHGKTHEFPWDIPLEFP